MSNIVFRSCRVVKFHWLGDMKPFSRKPSATVKFTDSNPELCSWSDYSSYHTDWRPPVLLDSGCAVLGFGHKNEMPLEPGTGFILYLEDRCVGVGEIERRPSLGIVPKAATLPEGSRLWVFENWGAADKNYLLPNIWQVENNQWINTQTGFVPEPELVSSWMILGES